MAKKEVKKKKKAEGSVARHNVKSGKVEKRRGRGNVRAGKGSGREAQRKINLQKPGRIRKHGELERQSIHLWEKVRCRNLEIEERSRLLSEILVKMNGKMCNMGTSHITSRVLQACLKHCRDAERDAIYVELQPHFLKLARDTYGRHLAGKMLFYANKNQLRQMISSLHGNVIDYLRHPAGSEVVELAYKMGNSVQKWELLSEFFSPEYRLFKDVGTKGIGRIKDILSHEPPSNQASVLEHMRMCLEPILEKGIVDHSIIHRALVEYLSIASKTEVSEITQQLSGPLLVRMVHTKDGARLGSLCVTCGDRKERKKIIKGLKGHVSKVARDEFGSVFLLSILSVVDDTKLVNKIIVREVAKELEDLVSHKYGQRPLLHLLSPYSSRYFPSDVLNILQFSMGFADTSGDDTLKRLNFVVVEGTGSGSEDYRASVKSIEGSSMTQKVEEDCCKDAKTEIAPEIIGVSRKNPFQRRLELLQSSGLAEVLVDICSKHAGKLLRSPIGKNVIYEVATGGHKNIMWHAVSAGVTSVHEAIAEVSAQPHASVSNSGDAEEHVLEQYHSSRVIRRLVMECGPPPFASEARSFSAILWDKALKGKCGVWAKGHSEKVISAFRECTDADVKAAAEIELQPMINSGLLQSTSAVSDKRGNKRKQIDIE